MYRYSMILTLTMLFNNCQSQDHGGFQQYYYTGGGSSSIVPKIYYQNRKKWYGELRYNYEAPQTLSLNAGKMFSGKSLFSYSITPIAGIVFGKLNGITAGTSIEVDYKRIYFSSEIQNTFSAEKRSDNLLFSWSELGYEITGAIYGGFALQMTHQTFSGTVWEPGIMMGWLYKSWTFPLYIFNPGGNNRNFVAGINWEWAHGGNKKN
jgi:hypothetical protein